LFAIGVAMAVADEGLGCSMSGVDILAGRSLLDVIWRNAAPETVAETISLTNGVLTCQLEL
jgi:hypothetical protein